MPCAAVATALVTISPLSTVSLTVSWSRCLRLLQIWSSSALDVIVTGSNPVVAAAMKATTTIPIVMTNVFDPVGAGLVASLARPGGNVTGVTGDTGHEIWGKRLDLLKE